jgi:hypothetical protein
MHDLLRLYAIERQRGGASVGSGIGETEAEKARRRLYTYYQNTTRTANTHIEPKRPTDTINFSDRAHALAWLDSEHANLIATVANASDHQPRGVAP